MIFFRHFGYKITTKITTKNRHMQMHMEKNLFFDDFSAIFFAHV